MIPSEHSEYEDPPKVKIQILKEGVIYAAAGKKLGPYSLEEIDEPEFKTTLAAELGVQPKDILAAELRELRREITVDEILKITSTTVKHDNPTKAILFLNLVNTYTEEDQGNVALQGESASGKSYVALELAQYFPEEDVVYIAGASPTSFYHEAGAWDKEKRAIVVDLERKILVFLDQPHYSLLEKLRPLLSHDRKVLQYKITDKSQKHGLRTKVVLIKGYPTIVFCSAKFSMDEQEKTRLALLSPETSDDKLIESLYLIAKKLGNRDAFKDEIRKDPRRMWLKRRVAAIKNAGIRNVVIEDQESLCKRFIEDRKHLIPRYQRDFPRLIGLIKAHALMNWANRESAGNSCIKASDQDIGAGFKLYDQIATPNELGISPGIWEIFQKVIKPLFKDSDGVDKKDIMRDFRAKFHRSLSFRTLRDEILPTLEGAGLIIQDFDPNDKRRTLVYPPDARDISNGGQDKKCPGDVEGNEGSCAVCAKLTSRHMLDLFEQPTHICSDECEKKHRGRV